MAIRRARALRRGGGLVFVVLAWGLGVGCGWGGGLEVGPEFTGMRDASAVVVLDEDRLAVAGDEDNTIRVYSRSRPGRPIKTFKLGSSLEVKPFTGEADLEGAARVGDRIYWIGSHNAGNKGRDALARSVLFATEVRGSGDAVELVPVGKVYRELLAELDRDPRWREVMGGAAIRRGNGGPGPVDIEGLASTTNGGLLVGLRSPTVGGRALILPVENPGEVVEGGRARFGDPVTVALDGLGIRDLAGVGSEYVIVAGPANGKGKFRIYVWGGPGQEAVRVPGIDFGDLHPEAVAVFGSGAGRRYLFLSDDGRLEGGGKARFRSVWARF